MPFVVEMVKQMAQQKLLCPAVEKVKGSIHRLLISKIFQAQEKTKLALERRAKLKAEKMKN